METVACFGYNKAQKALSNPIKAKFHNQTCEKLYFEKSE